METVYKLTNAEAKLAELLWNIAPIASMELIKIAEQEFGWKKSTTFSVLKILIEKGVAQNEKSTVTMLCTREQFISGQSRSYVEDTFGGSLPKFIASFIGGKKLTSKQAEELRRLIDEHEGGGNG
jgi:predicted transcriptional regulator